MGYDFLRTSLPVADNRQPGVTRSVGPFINEIDQKQPVPLRRFGLATGATDQRAKLVSAFAAGVPLDGEGNLYQFSGLIAVANPNLINTRLKQLDQTFSGTATNGSLYVEGPSVRMLNVALDRNGTGSAGAVTSAGHGFYFANCTNADIDVTISGNNKGTGVFLDGMIGGRAIVRCPGGMSFTDNAAVDDALMMAFVVNSSDLELRPYGKSLTGTAASASLGIVAGTVTPLFTRMVAVASSTRIRIPDFYLEKADQGIDITGGSRNTDIYVGPGTIRNMLSWGVKVANNGHRTRCVGSFVERCGAGGVVFSGPGAGDPDATDLASVIGVMAHNIGTCDAMEGGTPLSGRFSNPAAFSCIQHTAPALAPTNIMFDACTAVDDQTTKTMKYGFRNYTDDALTPSTTNTAVNCRSIGHITAATSGF